MKTPSVLLLVALAACEAAPTDTADTADDAAPCATLTTGRYRVNGSCFGMAMNVDLTFDEPTCSFTLGNWSMNHGDTVTGGTIDDLAVSLTGNGWDGCAGEVDGDTFNGTCPSDSCAWAFALQ